MSRIFKIALLIIFLLTASVSAADIYLVDQDRNGKIDIKDALAYMQSVAELRQTNTTLAHAIAVLQINASITVEAQEILKQQIETNGSQGNILSGQIPLDLGVNSSAYNIKYTDLGGVDENSLRFENEALLFQTAVDTEPGIYTVVAKFTPKDDPSKPVYKITFNYTVEYGDNDNDGSTEAEGDWNDTDPNVKPYGLDTNFGYLPAAIVVNAEVTFYIPIDDDYINAIKGQNLSFYFEATSGTKNFKVTSYEVSDNVLPFMDPGNYMLVKGIADQTGKTKIEGNMLADHPAVQGEKLQVNSSTMSTGEIDVVM